MEFNNTKIMKGIRYLLFSCAITIGLITIIATGGGNDDGDTAGDTTNNGGETNTNGETETGTLSIGLTDKFADDYQAVYVTIKEVSVHTSVDEQNAGEEQNNGPNEGDDTGEWQVIGTPNKTYNLLELHNGVIEQLALDYLEPAHYTQIRLLLGEYPDEGENILLEPHPEGYPNYVVTDADEYKELTVPSGYQTGIKLVHGFDIEAGLVKELVLDFDAQESIYKTGNGRYKLKPTIKVIDVEISSTISGIVTDGIEAIEGASVSAQVYDDTAADKKNEVIVKASTTTDENGEYKMILDEGAYNIVVYKEGYSPECTNVVLPPETDMTDVDFTLTSADTGSVFGEVIIIDGAEDQVVDISIRQSSGCGVIEVTSDNVADGALYSATLSVGTYSLVASTENSTEKLTLERTLEIVSGTDLELNLTFPGTVPSVSNLSYDPAQSIVYNGTITVTGSFSFIDDDGNVSTLITDIFGPEDNQVSVSHTETDIQGAVDGLTSDTIDIDLDFDTDSLTAGNYSFDVYVVDSDDNQSNVLTGEFIITEPI